MMMSLRRAKCRIRRFRDDDAAIISAETVIVTPLLIWVFLAMFVYWDAFRAQNTAIKGSYAIADMISRESAPINNAYITGMHNVFRYVNNTSEDTWVRVTSIRYVQSNDTFQVLWSRTSNAGRAPQHTAGTLNALRPRLPRPANTRTLIVVETWRRFTPAFQVGLDRRTFYNLEVTWPRFLEPLPIS